VGSPAGNLSPAQGEMIGEKPGCFASNICVLLRRRKVVPDTSSIVFNVFT
jgi:hypothetical protein